MSWRDHSSEQSKGSSLLHLFGYMLNTCPLRGRLPFIQRHCNGHHRHTSMGYSSRHSVSAQMLCVASAGLTTRSRRTAAPPLNSSVRRLLAVVWQRVFRSASRQRLAHRTGSFSCGVAASLGFQSWHVVGVAVASRAAQFRANSSAQASGVATV